MRNIVLITWDSVRADHCSCYGYKKETAPFLIARRGLKFENAIVSGLATSVSMGGIFTSQYFNGEFCGNTISKLLSSKGYYTMAFHSNPVVSRFFGFNNGFKIFKDYVWADDLGIGSAQTNPLRRGIVKLLKSLKFVDVERVRFYYNVFNVLVKGKDISYLRTADFYDDIINCIHPNNDNSFFLWVLMIETHFPYTPYNWGRWKKAKAMIIYDKYYRSGGVQKKLELNLEESELGMLLDAYDECIKEVDKLTRQLWNDLKDTDPIFIIHADHGEAFGEHGFFGHPPEHYEYLIRVPLIIYNADVKGVVKEPVSLLRLAPTICELAGVENEFSQPSLLEDVEYAPPIVENKLENGLRVTVRDKEWKLIVNPDREDELYNIKKDPMEQENLIEQEPDIEKELRKLAEKHIKTRKEKERLRKRIERLRGI